MKKKKISLVALMFTGSFLLFACGPTKNAGNTTLSIDESLQESQVSTEETVSTEEGAGDVEEKEEMQEEKEQEVPILRDSVQQTMGCFIGAAVAGSEADDPKAMEILTTHFSAVTLGNELKPDCIFNYSNGRVPGTQEVEFNGETMVVPNVYYDRAEKILDKIVAWNEENPDKTIKVRGHVLVWHAQTPEWFFHVDYDKNKPYVDKETMDKRLEWYIMTVLTHFTGPDSKYKDLFYGWDVVNEAVSDGGGYRTDNMNPDEPLSNDTHGSNSSWWHVYQSNEYIINAFIYANKYAPSDLELYYNDYNECETFKINSIVDLLTAVKEREGEPGVGTRISAMGMQGHYNMTSPTIDKIELAAKRYCAVVDNVQFTEMDMKARDSYDGSEASKVDEYEKQRARYGSIYYILKSINASDEVNITGITFWGTADHYSWLQSRSNLGGGNTGGLNQCPLLFDENYQPKPCFYVFANVTK